MQSFQNSLEWSSNNSQSILYPQCILTQLNKWHIRLASLSIYFLATESCFCLLPYLWAVSTAESSACLIWQISLRQICFLLVYFTNLAVVLLWRHGSTLHHSLLSSDAYSAACAANSGETFVNSRVKPSFLFFIFCFFSSGKCYSCYSSVFSNSSFLFLFHLNLLFKILFS